MEAKIDRRSRQTKAALIDDAEVLFGTFGFDNVSTRQIGAAIGSANKSVVAYHFGSKLKLMDAVFLRRAKEFEKRRSLMLEELDRDGSCRDLTRLLIAIWLPVFEQTNEKGLHSYAHFLNAMLTSNMARAGEMTAEHMPITRSVMDRVQEHIPCDYFPMVKVRWHICTTIVLNAILDIDKDPQLSGKPDMAQRMFADAITMAAAALAAEPDQDHVLERLLAYGEMAADNGAKR